MRVSLLLLTVAFICDVLCDQVSKKKFEIRDGIRKHRYGIQPSRGFIENPFNNFAVNNFPPSYYGLNQYAKNIPMIYNTRPYKFLPRPYPQLVPSVPSFTSFESPLTGYSIHGIPHPSMKFEPQTFYPPPTVSGFRSKGYPRYALSPVRQYVPHYYPLFTADVPVPPKRVNMQPTQLTTASSIRQSNKIPQSEDQTCEDNDECSDDGETEYHTNKKEPKQYESEDDDDAPNDGNDNEEDHYVDRKDEIVAEDRKDGPLEVNVLTGKYDADKKQKSDEHYSKKNGAQYSNQHKSKKGYKTSTGHESEDKFDKGEKGHHDKQIHYKEYEEEGANKKKHHDEKNEKGSQHKEDHGEKKGEFDEKKIYKKGAKSKGYHNVFHKDEFVKDHTFYDDLDQSGHYKKVEEEQQGHKKESTKHKKGSHLDSSKHAEKNGHRGKYSKGHHDDADSGYQKKVTKEQHYGNDNKYKKNGGQANNHNSKYLKGI